MCCLLSLWKKTWNYIKRDAFLYLFLSSKITQINWMYSKILLNVYFIQFFLLSEYLYDNILQWDASKYFYYNKILHNIGQKSVFLLVLSFMHLEFCFSILSLCYQLKVNENLNFIIRFHILVSRILEEWTRYKTSISSQHT